MAKDNTKSIGGFADLGKLYGLNTPQEEKSSASSFTYIEDKTAVKPRSSNSYNKHGSYQNRSFGNETPPTAPYNFVPLNTVVVNPALADFIKSDADEEMQSGYREFIKTGQKFSGYFDVQIENITPLYIGGEDGFFSDGENICIPGSSLRGCIKNLFKVVTNSGLNTNEDPDLTDKRLYYRGMASGYDTLRDAYNDRMVQLVRNNKGKKSNKSKAKAGFIVKKNKQYFICPGEYNTEKAKTGWRQAVKIANPPEPCVKWNNNNEATIFTGKMTGSELKFEDKLPKNLAKERILGHVTDRKGNTKVKVDTSKVHYYKIYNPQWHTLLTIPPDIVRDYLDDKNRKGLNLLAEKNNLSKGNATKNAQFDYIIPCFYTANGTVVEHFGAGPYYRIPYRESIGDHIPQEIKNPRVDFTSAVFGNKEHWASRVRFEDCFLTGGQRADFYDKDYVKVLMGPNPTSFQFYLNANGQEALHWDEKTKIRGYKFYWHRKIDWHEINDKMRKDSINKQIAPLKENHKFSGKIRFKNLDASELGALCYILSLCQNKDICFKLGMGKPVGMGSVKVTAQLKLQNAEYYKALFDGTAFAQANTADMQSFSKNFTDYMNAQLAKNNSDQMNYQRRITALMDMLNIKYMQSDSWNTEQTRYFDVNNRDDKKTLNRRIPLPSIAEVIKQIK